MVKSREAWNSAVPVKFNAPKFNLLGKLGFKKILEWFGLELSSAKFHSQGLSPLFQVAPSPVQAGFKSSRDAAAAAFLGKLRGTPGCQGRIPEAAGSHSRLSHHSLPLSKVPLQPNCHQWDSGSPGDAVWSNKPHNQSPNRLPMELPLFLPIIIPFPFHSWRFLSQTKPPPPAQPHAGQCPPHNRTPQPRASPGIFTTHPAVVMSTPQARAALNQAVKGPGESRFGKGHP